jgi:hypothetical protein
MSNMKAASLLVIVGLFAATQPAHAGYVTWFVVNSAGDAGSSATFVDNSGNVLSVSGSFDYDANYILDAVSPFANVNLTTHNSDISGIPGLAVGVPAQVGGWYIDPAVSTFDNSALSGNFGFVVTNDPSTSPTHDFTNAFGFSLQSFGDPSSTCLANDGSCLLDGAGVTQVLLEFGLDGTCDTTSCQSVAISPLPSNGELVDGSFINGDFGQQPSSGTPEPATFLLMGASFMVVGLARKKFSTRR